MFLCVNSNNIRFLRGNKHLTTSLVQCYSFYAFNNSNRLYLKPLLITFKFAEVLIFSPIESLKRPKQQIKIEITKKFSEQKLSRQ